MCRGNLRSGPHLPTTTFPTSLVSLARALQLVAISTAPLFVLHPFSRTRARPADTNHPQITPVLDIAPPISWISSELPTGQFLSQAHPLSDPLNLSDFSISAHAITQRWLGTHHGHHIDPQKQGGRACHAPAQPVHRSFTYYADMAGEPRRPTQRGGHRHTNTSSPSKP